MWECEAGQVSHILPCFGRRNILFCCIFSFDLTYTKKWNKSIYWWLIKPMDQYLSRPNQDVFIWFFKRPMDLGMSVSQSWTSPVLSLHYSTINNKMYAVKINTPLWRETDAPVMWLTRPSTTQSHHSSHCIRYTGKHIVSSANKVVFAAARCLAVSLKTLWIFNKYSEGLWLWTRNKCTF